MQLSLCSGNTFGSDDLGLLKSFVVIQFEKDYFNYELFVSWKEPPSSAHVDMDVDFHRGSSSFIVASVL